MKNKTYTVNVRLKALVSFEITADTLETALTKAREEVKDTRFIDEGVEYIDGSEELIGVSADWDIK